MTQLIGQILGDRYLIKSLLGKQTGRRTFLAEDSQARGSVVLKLILFGPDFTWEDLKLFEREAETLKSLDHPAIPKYLDSFEVETPIGKGFVLVQSYIEARSLQDWATAGRRFSEPDLRTIALSLLEILQYLHSQSPAVIHRDIKPSNILLGDRTAHSVGKVYLVDFGSVQSAARGGTMTVVGTYGYMPPEQFGGRSLPASDLYSLGATLVYLTTGKHPADLTGDNFQLAFSEYATVSPLFSQWLTQLTYADLARRTISARVASQQLSEIQEKRQSPVPSDSLKMQPLAELDTRSLTHKDFSTVSSDCSLAIEFFQYRAVSMLEHNSNQARHIVYIVLAVAATLASSSLYVGGWNMLIGITLVAPILYLVLAILDSAIVRKVRLRKARLSLDKMPNGTHLLSVVSLPVADTPGKLFIKKLGTATRFTHMPVRLLTVSKIFWGYQYQLSFLLGKEKNISDRTFQMTGSRQDIRWLCSEISRWSDVPIEHGRGWP